VCPPRLRAPRQAASMTPLRPPQTRAQPRLASTRPTSSASASAFSEARSPPTTEIIIPANHIDRSDRRQASVLARGGGDLTGRRSRVWASAHCPSVTRGTPGVFAASPLHVSFTRFPGLFTALSLASFKLEFKVANRVFVIGVWKDQRQRRPFRRRNPSRHSFAPRLVRLTTPR